MGYASYQEDSGYDGEEGAPGFILISTYKFTFQMSDVPFKEVISPSQELSWVYGVQFSSVTQSRPTL